MPPEIAFAAVVTFLAAQRPIEVGVTVHRRTGVLEDRLTRAREHVARIYAEAGIVIVWHEPVATPDCLAGHVELVVGIVARPERRRQVQDKALGMAVPGATGAGGLAYVFNEHVERAARTNRADPAAVMGHAIAHELGHLLLPYGSHSAAGLMRGRWQTPEFNALVNRRLLFSSHESRLMRERVEMFTGLARDASAPRTN